MGTTNLPAARVDLDPIAEDRPHPRQLTDAWTRALERDERPVSRIWRRLRADSHPVSPTPTGD